MPSGQFWVDLDPVLWYHGRSLICRQHELLGGRRRPERRSERCLFASRDNLIGVGAFV